MKFSLKETQSLKPSLNIPTEWRGFLQGTGGKSPLNATTSETGQRRSDWERWQGKCLIKWRDLYSMKTVLNEIINEFKIRHQSQHAVKKMTGPCPLGTTKRIAFIISKNSLPRCWKSPKASSELVVWILALSPFPKMPHISEPWCSPTLWAHRGLGSEQSRCPAARCSSQRGGQGQDFSLSYRLTLVQVLFSAETYWDILTCAFYSYCEAACSLKQTNKR